MLGERCKVGNFVEVKTAAWVLTSGQPSKLPGGYPVGAGCHRGGSPPPPPPPVRIRVSLRCSSRSWHDPTAQRQRCCCWMPPMSKRIPRRPASTKGC
ncbi:MAG: hypothetical protein OXG70_03615 [Cyanobacteria bacterium MAG IRC1_bin_28]|nr:hypothetical protein [Cyanobacteria bacterium MAG IRC1_bin_28]